MQRRDFLRLAAASPLAARPFAASAEDNYPARPITVVVAFSAGGNSDIRSRQTGTEAQKILGQPIIVENKPGASGNIGHDFVAHAQPDGDVRCMGARGPRAVNPGIYPKLNFDPLRDFTPIVLVEKAPLVLVTRTDKPFRSLKDVVAAAKAKPGSITVGNAGPGGAHHLSAELFKQQAGIDMLSVPYKGGGHASTALLAGETDMMFEQTYAALPGIQGGKTRALAVTSEKRLPSLPDVPTMAELGYPKVTVSNWLGLIGPRNLPAPIVKKLNADYNQVLAKPSIQEKITGPGNEIGGGSPEQFAAFIAAENKRWAQVVKAAGIRME